MEMVGPRNDEVGLFGARISRFWADGPKAQEFFLVSGEADSLNLVRELGASGKLAKPAAGRVDEAFAYPGLQLSALNPRSEAH